MFPNTAQKHEIKYQKNSIRIELKVKNIINTTDIEIILNKLIITEEQILEMKKEKDMEKCEQKANKIKNTLKLKLIIFFVLSSVLMLIFWYFISCFCSVYENTQIILIEDTTISFLLSMIYPFGIKLLPGIFRIQALRAPKRDQKYKYKISLLLSMF